MSGRREAFDGGARIRFRGAKTDGYSYSKEFDIERIRPQSRQTIRDTQAGGQAANLGAEITENTPLTSTTAASAIRF